MATLVRVLTRHHKWPKIEEIVPEWFEKYGDVPADALELFPTDDNGLSVYQLTAGNDPNAKLRVVAALQLKRTQSISSAGCVAFSSDVLTALNIAVEEHHGQTADTTVNGWHRDIVNLSAGQLAALVRVIVLEGAFESYSRTDIVRSAKAAHAARELLVDQLSAHVSKDLT